MEQDDSLYERARQILQAEPGMGKQRLAKRLGVRTPTSLRRLPRLRGEIQGQRLDRVYQKVRRLKDANPGWGAARIAPKEVLTQDRLPALAGPADGTALRDDMGSDKRSLGCRSPNLRTLEGLLVCAQLVPPLCPPHAWHSRRGYSNKLAAEARYWEEGCVATSIHSPSQSPPCPALPIRPPAHSATPRTARAARLK
jgi:hypothetical protein